MRGAMAKLKPGTIIRVAKGNFRGPVAVVATAHRKAGVRLTAITKGEEVLQIDGEDLVDLPEPVGAIKLPPNFGPQRKGYRRDVAKRLRTAKIGSDRAASAGRRPGPRRMHADELDVARDPDLRRRLDAASRADRLVHEIERLQERVDDKNQSLGQEFDRVLELLDACGYADTAAWELTEDGQMLAGIFHETDLLVAEMLRGGVLDGLDAADLAAIVSCVVYEHRSPEPPAAPWFSSKQVRARWQRLDALSEDLRARERSVGLGEHRAPGPDVRCRGTRLGRRGGFRRDRRRRGTDRGRLRSDHEAADRPPASSGDGLAGSRRAPGCGRSGRRGPPRGRARRSGSGMTISKGASWGEPVQRPAGLRIATSDSALAAMLADDTGVPVAIAGGDLFRTLGSRPIGDRDEVMAFPIDLVDVSLDGEQTAVAVAHVVARRATWRGGAWRGPVLAVMNAEFMGDYDVAPRGHPNDGRVETFEVAASMGVRQRWESRRRMRNASHLPHPAISTRSVRRVTFDFTADMRVFADGIDIGSTRSLGIAVRPDAAVVHS